MGNAMVHAGRFAMRKARRFNVENRTMKFLDENKKIVAPTFAATASQREKIHEANPDLMKELAQKDEGLNNRLKGVYVSSFDPPAELQQSNRPLPSLRNVGLPPEFGYVEPESNTPGRISLRRAIEMLSKYQLKKREISLETLALEYNLKLKDVENIISYYSVFRITNQEVEGIHSIGQDEPTVLEIEDAVSKHLSNRNKKKNGEVLGILNSEKKE